MVRKLRQKTTGSRLWEAEEKGKHVTVDSGKLLLVVVCFICRIIILHAFIYFAYTGKHKRTVVESYAEKEEPEIEEKVPWLMTAHLSPASKWGKHVVWVKKFRDKVSPQSVSEVQVNSPKQVIIVFVFTLVL